MTTAMLSRFTPSLLTAGTLEQLFVQRAKLATTVVAGIRESALSQNKHYYLMTGPRGIGKTHFVSLVYHRLEQDESLRGHLHIAWLREEEWGVASYLDLLLVVLRAFPKVETDSTLSERYQRIKQLTDPRDAQTAAEALLLEAIGSQTLLIIAENLDEIFRGLEEDGQQSLRALIQNNPVFTLLGTSQSLFDGVTDREQPFYGFFDVHQLSELTFDCAVELVSKIARLSGDGDLAELLASPRGRARMRAVHHLAAGNPRVYVIFSQFITSTNLDDLVQPLLETLDDLTPYYQSRMAHLSPQQRKLVEYLCERRGAATVSEIAQSNFVSPQTTSSQLRKLDQLGYVRSEQFGRTSHYELREPLLRLTLEVKKRRGEPVRLIVEFLRVWYSERELSARLGELGSDGDRHYVDRAYPIAEELLTVSDSVEDYERVIGLPCAPGLGAQVARALMYSALELLRASRAEEGEATLDRAMTHVHVNHELSDVDAARYLLETTQIESDWRRVVPALVAAFKKRDCLARLGVGLVGTIPKLADASFAGASAARWLQVWKDSAGSESEMRIALRILSAAIAKLKEGNDAALQSLPVEEREVLNQLLGDSAINVNK